MTVDLRVLQQDASREAVLDAAQALARRDGLNGLSMRAIAAAVGVRAPSLYSYFASKDAIYDGLFRRGYEALLALQEAEGPRMRAMDATTAFAATFELFLRFCQEDWTRYQLMFTRAVPGWTPAEDAYAPSLRSLEMTRDLLAHHGAAEPGDLDLYTAISAGLAAQQFANDPDGDRWFQLSHRAAAMFFAAIQP